MPCYTKIWCRTHSHDSIHQAALLFGTLQPLHGPPVHRGGDPRVVNVQQSEACHVDPAVAVRLQIQGKQILRGKKAAQRFKLSITPSAFCRVDAPRQLSQGIYKARSVLLRPVSPIKQLKVRNFSHQSGEEEVVVLGHHSHRRKLKNENKM